MPVSFPKTAVIIPAFNEEQSIGLVVNDIPKDLAQWIIVADNGSCDGTAQVAKASGAVVVSEPRTGYGNACLAGIASLPDKAEVVVFLDGDYSDFPGEMRRLLSVMQEQKADMVIGSRVLGHRESGSLTPQQRLGNRLSSLLIRWIYGFAYTDLGPFRAIRVDALKSLNMQDQNFGWTVEMQVKAVQQGLKIVETPVNYRKRIGKSKVSGTLSGTIKAGAKILWTIGKLAIRQPDRTLARGRTRTGKGAI
jgi:glycosyltransferase involved in cell wall biosynthesis